MAQVILENVYKSFSSRQEQSVITSVTPEEQISSLSNNINVLRRINLHIAKGEFMVLVGPSGCGKSTLLRLIAGLEELTAGNIWVDDHLVNDLPPKDRDIAMVFQNYALYPHKTVYENIAFGLRRRQTPYKHFLQAWSKNLLVAITRSLPFGLRYISAQEKAIQDKVKTVAQLLQIEPLLHRLPKQLSGGQKQRVALGRAIARHPQVFLMDEPLSNLDAKLRAETRAQIVKLQKQLGTTTIYVTHDQTEAMTMGDRIAVMNGGQIQQIASPLELYNYPANRFVAEFIGSPPMNFLSVTVESPLLITHPQFRLVLPQIWASLLQPYQGRSLILGLRPEHFNISVDAPENLPVKVELVEALGHETYLLVKLRDVNATVNSLQVRIPPDTLVKLGEEISLSIDVNKIHLFEPENGIAIFPN